jgi:hypothetical protein
MLSRRQLLGSALATGATLAVQKSGAQPAKRTIVDAQVHLWKAETEDWKWVPGVKPQMPEPFTIEKLVPLMDRRASTASWWCRRRGRAIATTTLSRRSSAIRAVST